MWDESEGSLSVQVLEQFCAPEWFGMAYEEHELPCGVTNVTPGENWRVVARKSDDETKRTVTEIVEKRYFVWSAELAEAAEQVSKGGSTSCGMIMAQLDGWEPALGDSQRGWVHWPRVMAWLEERTAVSLLEAETELGINRARLANKLLAEGWTVRAVGPKRLSRWFGPQ